MITKELVLNKLKEVSESEPIFQEILEMLKARKPKRMFKGCPLLRPEDLKKMDNDLPVEPEWEKVWEEENKE